MERMEPVSYAAVEEDGTSGLVIEFSDDSDKVGADVVLLHGCPQICMPNPVEGLPEVYEDMVKVLLVLEIFPTEEHRHRGSSFPKRYPIHVLILHR